MIHLELFESDRDIIITALTREKDEIQELRNNSRNELVGDALDSKIQELGQLIEKIECTPSR